MTEKTERRAAGRTCLVTGAAGFIGSHLTDKLLTMGFRVLALDNFSSGTRKNIEAVERSVGPEAFENFTMVECDIRDTTQLGAIFDQIRPEVVFHLAALGSVPRS